MKKRFLLALFLIIGIILILNFLPDYYALIKTPPGHFYSGQASWFDPWDINVYFTAIRWGQKGNILLENLYTTERNKPAFVHTLYTITGYLFPKTNPILLFHLLSLVTGLLLSVFFFLFSYLLLKDFTYSLVALILISLGGGLGWMLTKFAPADLFASSFTTRTAFQRPHEAIGTLLYISSLIFFLFFLLRKRVFFAILSFFSLLFLILFYPYYILSYGIITGTFIILTPNGKRFQWGLFFLLFSLPVLSILVVLYFVHLNSSSSYGLINEKVGHPGIVSLILGYGAFLPFYFYQLSRLKRDDAEKLFLNLWFLLSILLSFLPFGFARLYLRGLFFPLTILSLTTLPIIFKRFVNIKPLLVLVLISTIFSSLYIFSKRMMEVKNQNRWYYLPVEIKEAFNFLERQKKDGVLAGYTLGNYLPAHTGKRVYFGHLIQTPKARSKFELLSAFYSGRLREEDALEFLKKNKISFIVLGKEERKIGKPRYRFLKRIYKNSKVEIFTRAPGNVSPASDLRDSKED